MINEKQLDITLVSIIPNLVGGEGHIIPYHIAVNQATKILGWQHKLAYSSDSTQEKITNLPDDWHDCLDGDNLEAEANLRGQIGKLTKVFPLAKSIANYLKNEVLSESKKTLIFLERFIHLQLLAFWLATLLIPPKNLTVWILYRRDIHNHKTRIIYKLLNKLIKNRVSSENFQLLTDSKLLSKSLSNYFQEKVTVMPIPHTELIENKTENKDDLIFCWWAGPPREEKGWEVIRNMTKYQSLEAEKFCLVAAKSSQLTSIKGGVKVNLIEDNISRLEYVKWLAKSDFILLPYDPEAYKERTSGIFTEAIIAGKIVVVTPNTWMAQELGKYNLENLVIDWHNMQNVFQHFQEILDARESQEKIKFMQKEYVLFHNVNNYAMTMKILVS
jgi:hypothetical protein